VLGVDFERGADLPSLVTQGKYLEIEFDAQGGPVGAVITNYLLEKVRLSLPLLSPPYSLRAVLHRTA
jgi:hypothetical protein